MGKRTWTKEDVERLEALWGWHSYAAIAKSVGHTETAVRVKAKRLGLGAVKDASDYLCSREVARIMGIDSHVVTGCWIGRLGLPCRRVRGKRKTLWVMVRHDHLMEFLEEHTEIWDSRRVEPYALGEEPEWLHEKRLADRRKGDVTVSRWCRKS